MSTNPCQYWLSLSDHLPPNKARGPKPNAAKAIDRRVATLELDNEKLREKLDRTEQIIDVQKGENRKNGGGCAQTSGFWLHVVRDSNYRGREFSG